MYVIVCMIKEKERGKQDGIEATEIEEERGTEACGERVRLRRYFLVCNKDAAYGMIWKEV